MKMIMNGTKFSKFNLLLNLYMNVLLIWSACCWEIKQCNSPEELKSHLHHGSSLKSVIILTCYCHFLVFDDICCTFKGSTGVLISP